MVNRNVGSPLLEITQRVATGAHHLANEGVSLADSCHGFVDEPRLNAPPGLTEALALGSIQQPYVQAFDSLFSSFEVGLGPPLVAALGDCLVVLGAEALAQLLAMAASHGQHDSYSNKCHDDYDRHHDVRKIPGIHELLLLRYLSRFGGRNR